MAQPLFFEPEPYIEKASASETELPEDPNQWPQEILQELYKQVPYIADFEPHVQMDRADGEKGYGFGHVQVQNQSEAQIGAPVAQMRSAGIRTVRVPIIIKNGKLKPFDILVTDDSSIRPLTEGRLRQAAFRPQAFDVTGRTPGDQSMIGQLYPPYRQNYGFGGGGVAMNAGMGKQSSVEKDAKARWAKELGKEFKKKDLGEVIKGFTKKVTGKEQLDPAFHLASQKGGVGASGPARELVRSAKEKVKAGSALDEYLLAEGVKHGQLGKKTSEGELGDGTGGALTAFVEKNASVGIVPAESAWDVYDKMQKNGSVLRAILPTVNESDYHKLASSFESVQAQAALLKNHHSMGPALAVLSEYEPVKLGSISSLIRPTVVQIRREPDGYLIKSANHRFWDPTVEHVGRDVVVERFGGKIALAADTEGSVTKAEGEGVEEPEEVRDEDTQSAMPISESGLYKVIDEQGNEHIGMVIVGLKDCDGQEVPLSLFTNGSKAAVQTDIVGQPAGEAFDLPTGDLDQKKGYGFFFAQGAEGIEATVPLNITSSMQGPDGTYVCVGETFDGRPCEISIQPNIQTIVQTPEGRTLIPEGWQWSPLESTDALALESSEEDVGLEDEAKLSMASVLIRSDGSTFTIDGPGLMKLGADEKNFLNLDDAAFLLAGLGVNLGYGMKKLGEAYNGREPVRVRIGRVIEPANHVKLAAVKAAQERHLINWRKDLVKEATNIPDPVAVDTVLSLGFLNPENVMTFISYLPVIEEAQSRMCELLLAARLGLQNIPESALEKAVRSTEEVLEGLKVLAFQGG